MLHAPSRLKANLLLLVVATIWGSAFIAQNIASKAGLAFLYNGASFTIAALVLAPLAVRRGFSPKQIPWMIAAGVLLFGGSALQQLGLFYTKVANASFLTSLYVIFTPFLLWLGYKERPRTVHLVAAAAATVGAFLLSTGGTYALQWGDFLEILGALFWGFHLVLVAKYASPFDPISFAAGQFLVCGLLNFAFGSFTEPFPALLSSSVVAAVAYRSLLSIAVGYTAQVWAQRFTSATDAALIFSMESVAAAVVAALFLGERLAAPQLAGCTLILVAASLSQVPQRAGQTA